jgi:hypothetical protein
MMSKKIFRWAMITLALIALFPVTMSAAHDDVVKLELHVRRDWGYGGFNNDIQGRFTMSVDGPDDLIEVRFRIDGELIGVDDEAPFATQFHTDDFSTGIHELSAIGLLADGDEAYSDVLKFEFVSNEFVRDSMGRMMIPIVGIILLFMVAGILGPVLLNRGGKQRPVGEYNIAGAAVCSRCALPFSRHMMAPNLLAGKLARCPHCGKWQLAARAWGDSLADAETRLRAENAEGGDIDVAISEEERLRRQIEDSRFDG